MVASVFAWEMVASPGQFILPLQACENTTNHIRETLLGLRQQRYQTRLKNMELVHSTNDSALLTTVTFQDIHISFWLNFIRVNILFAINISTSNAYENIIKCLNVKMYSVEVLCVTLLILFNKKTNAVQTPVEL